MESVLITGASGFIGRNILKYLSDKSIPVVGIGHENIYTKKILGKYDCKMYCGEINSDLLHGIQDTYDTVIHCAGVGSIGKAEGDPSDALKKTVLSTQCLLDYACKKREIKKIIYLSSAAVYGDTGNVFVKEDFPQHPTSIYGIQKCICEQLCKYYRKRYSLNIDIIRPFSVIGEGMEKQLFWDACNKFKNMQFDFWGTGKETRDWLHIDDLVSLIYLCAVSFEKNMILNASNGIPLDNKKILEKIRNQYFLKNIEEEIKFNNQVNKNDPINLVGDNALARKKLGWKTKVGYMDAIQRYVSWYMKYTRERDEFI